MLNERAREILDFIRTFTRDKGYPPTIREIGKAFHIRSTNGVRYYLGLLEKDGHLTRHERISRGLDAGPGEAAGIRVLGRVAAGRPITADECYEGSIEPSAMFGDPKGLFALRVRGDSMIEAGILDGDYVIVRHQSRANTGEIIVALLADEATVKYYRPGPQRVELVAANPEHKTIVVQPGDDFRIAGIVKGVMRTVGK
jgi:repressor LexA